MPLKAWKKRKKSTMLNKKFLTRLLNDDFRRSIMAKNNKFIESKDLKLKAYATYVVDKYNNDRDKAFIDVKEANHGYSPLEVLAYVAKDGSIKKAFFEFNMVSHFLKKKEHTKAVEVAICILSELAKENKKDIMCFDIDKIDTYLKKIEQEWMKKQEKEIQMSSNHNENDQKELSSSV